MTPETALVGAFFESPEGTSLFYEEFLPEVGGDGDEYGIDDVTTVTVEQLIDALRIFMQSTADWLSPDVVAAARTESVDWPAVYRRIKDPYA